MSGLSDLPVKPQYGLTSLSPPQASATDLLTFGRGHWAIENQSPWVRAVVLGEGGSQVRCGVILQVMSALHNTALAVLRFAGYHRVAQTMRYFAGHPQHALTLINGKN